MTTPFLQPYEYNYITSQIKHLFNTYKSVNDSVTIKTLQALTKENISLILLKESIREPLFESLMDRQVTTLKTDKIYSELLQYVIPFVAPSDKQLAKIFKKTKKLKYPNWHELDLFHSSFIGWNDKGTNRKYIAFYNENGDLTGYFGTLSQTIQKGACMICNTISNVSLFLSTTASAGDGTYTKNGNYICHDSNRCNKQMSHLNGFENFISIVKQK